MKRTPINPISPRQQAIRIKWGNITIERMKLLKEIFGIPICEWCGQPGHDNPIQVQRVEQFSFGGAPARLRTKLISRLAEYRRHHEEHHV